MFTEVRCPLRQSADHREMLLLDNLLKGTEHKYQELSPLLVKDIEKQCTFRNYALICQSSAQNPSSTEGV